MKKNNNAIDFKVFFFSVLTYCAFSLFIATYYFAYKVNFNPLLKGIYFEINGKRLIDIPFYFPFIYPYWHIKFSSQVPSICKNIVWYLKTGLLAYICMLLLYFNNKNKVSVHGTARWANKSEIKKMDLKADRGLVLGCDPYKKIMRENTDKHVFMAAPTRGGKGINTVTPTSLDWDKSIVFNDIKGELWGLTSKYRKNVLKQKVFMFSPVDTDGISCSYNPLDVIKIGTGHEFEDVSIISETLIDTEGKGESDHWITSAINLLNAVLLHCKYVDPEASLYDVITFLSPTTQSFTDQLCDILCMPREFEDAEDFFGDDEREGRKNRENCKPFDHLKRFDDKDIFKKIYGYTGTEEDKLGHLHPLVAKEFSTLVSTPDKERGSIISSTTSKLKIFNDPIIQQHIKKSDFTIRELMQDKCSVYLVTPPRSIDRTRALIRLIFTQIVYELTDRMKFETKEKEKLTFSQKIKKSFKNAGKKIKNFFIVPEKKEEKNRILLLIDEFPSLGKLGVVERAMSYIAGYGLKCLLIAQSLKQFKKIYGKDNYILDNCSIQIYLTPNDEESPKMLSDMFDSYTEKIVNTSKKGWEFISTRSTSYVPRKLMTPGEVRTMPYEDIIVMMTGQNPIKGKKLFYYKDKRYAAKLIGCLDRSDFGLNRVKSGFKTEKDISFEDFVSDYLVKEFIASSSLVNNANENDYSNMVVNITEKIMVITDRLSKDKEERGLVSEMSKLIKSYEEEKEEFLKTMESFSFIKEEEDTRYY